VPAGISKGALAPCGGHFPPVEMLQSFCALVVVTTECSVDELFIYALFSLSVVCFAPDPTGAPSLDPAGKLSFSDPVAVRGRGQAGHVRTKCTKIIRVNSEDENVKIASVFVRMVV